MNILTGYKQRLAETKTAYKDNPKRWWSEFLLNNSLYIFLVAAIIGIAIYEPALSRLRP